MVQEDNMRRVRKKFYDTATISITSLLDVLTIILVFLIKNVSMEAQKLTVPENMSLPTTITNQELIDNGLTVLVKLYSDNRVLIGTDNLPAGTLKDLVENPRTREVIYNYMQNEANQITAMNTKRGTNYQPCLLIQADKKILCQYITQLVKIGAGASFANIYFSTLQDENWLQSTAQRVQ
jgi:biopolymer transport protein ExbD